MRHSPGIPLRDWVPRSLKRRPEPATKSLTVLDTQNLASTGKRRNPRAYVNSDTADIVTDHFALACMKSSTDLDAERLDLIGYGASAADATRRAIKSCKKAIAGRLHLTATERASIRRIVAWWSSSRLRQRLSPRLAAFSVEPTISVNRTVASMRSASTRAGAPVRNSSIASEIFFCAVTDVEDMINSRKLEQLGTRNMGGYVAPAGDIDNPVFRAVKHKCRHSDR
jgi:hypothetical protein